MHSHPNFLARVDGSQWFGAGVAAGWSSESSD